MSSRKTNIILCGGLVVIAAVGLLIASNVSAAGAGEQCDPKYNNCPANYICKKKSASALSFTCECAWGETEVGLLNIKKDVSICALVAGQGGGVGALVWFIQQAITVVMALTIMAAVVSIVIGGYIYMTAGGDADRVRTAKVWIEAAILGIILALLAWLILRSIATNLVEFPPSTPSLTPSSTPFSSP